MAKTRNLSVAEYFLAVQKEYLIAEFRRKIYFNPKDKTYYSKVMKFKQEKINDIADRNGLNSVLNDSAKLSEVHNELFSKNGQPKFEMNEEDIQNYYSTGNEFSYKGNIWILDQIGQNSLLTLYSNEKEEYITDIKREEVSRIL